MAELQHIVAMDKFSSSVLHHDHSLLKCLTNLPSWNLGLGFGLWFGLCEHHVEDLSMQMLLCDEPNENWDCKLHQNHLLVWF